jgi:hypothetical protein
MSRPIALAMIWTCSVMVSISSPVRTYSLPWWPSALNVTTPTVVKMATRMTAAGLLTQRRDDRDNRLAMVLQWRVEPGMVLRGRAEW